MSPRHSSSGEYFSSFFALILELPRWKKKKKNHSQLTCSTTSCAARFVAPPRHEQESAARRAIHLAFLTSPRQPRERTLNVRALLSDVILCVHLAVSSSSTRDRRDSRHRRRFCIVLFQSIRHVLWIDASSSSSFSSSRSGNVVSLRHSNWHHAHEDSREHETCEPSTQRTSSPVRSPD